jgi:hypothetical protein
VILNKKARDSQDKFEFVFAQDTVFILQEHSKALLDKNDHMIIFDHSVNIQDIFKNVNIKN